jgi:hypothetical protein
MMEGMIFETLERALKDQQEDIKTILANGGPKDFAAYSRLVGMHESLANIAALVRDLKKRVVEA